MQSTGCQNAGQDLATERYTYTYTCVCIHNTTVYTHTHTRVYAYITQLSVPKVWLNYSICALHIREKKSIGLPLPKR